MHVAAASASRRVALPVCRFKNTVLPGRWARSRAPPRPRAAPQRTVDEITAETRSRLESSKASFLDGSSVKPEPHDAARNGAAVKAETAAASEPEPEPFNPLKRSRPAPEAAPRVVVPRPQGQQVPWSVQVCCAMLLASHASCSMTHAAYRPDVHLTGL
jgi:hypothetical protein